MDRERQIKMLEAAKPRMDQRIADWLQDKDVKSAIRQIHEETREEKHPSPKRAYV